jgi:hypothetical protein
VKSAYAVLLVALALVVAGVAVATTISGNPGRLDSQPHASGDWRAPPGVYRLRNIHSDLCLRYAPAGSAAEQPHLEQGGCTQTFTVVPNPSQVDAYKIRFDFRDPDNDVCATLARFVALGAPRIDLLACDRQTDQDFRLVMTGRDPDNGDVYEIRAHGNGCWSVREESRDPGADLLQWDCLGHDSQRFRLERVSGLVRQADVDQAIATGWGALASPTPQATPNPPEGQGAWRAPPGRYRIWSVRSDLCLAAIAGGNTAADLAEGPAFSIVRPPYAIAQEQCGSSAELANATFAVAPSPNFPGRYLFRHTGGGGNPANGRCATVARNVIAGNPRIDLIDCELGAQGARSVNQTFALEFVRSDPRGGEVFTLHTWDGHCWGVAGGAEGLNAFIEQQPCDSSDAQAFRFRWQGALGPDLQPYADQAGWPASMSAQQAAAPVTPRALRSPATGIAPRAVPPIARAAQIAPRPGAAPPPVARMSCPLSNAVDLRDIDLPGGDYGRSREGAVSPTACRTACAAECRCRAFTWSPPPLQGAGSSCRLKDGVPTPVQSVGAVSGYLRR